MTDQPTPIAATDQRVVRVFISSTFQDMQAEREELVKFTFPELRKRCRERQVEFVEVDLRWGVTDEQNAEGRVLPICLEEIKRCRPYFIGLLGERYGWVPEAISQELMEQEEWLKEHLQHSVTELEILHGVIRNPEMAEHAFFYFRDPKASLKVEDQLAGKPDYKPEPQPSGAKLQLLKEKIRGHCRQRSPDRIRENYLDAKTLGKLALDDLWGVIDKRFPVVEIPTILERERAGHEAFGSLRTKVYIERQEYFDRLNDHVAAGGPPLVILGESGSGKSALIANWAEKYRETHPGDFMVCHYTGSTPDSADYVSILRRIMEEVKERYEPGTKDGGEGISRIRSTLAGRGAESEIPTDPKKIVEAFPLWLARAAAPRGRLILVLDALNQLDDRDNAPDLGWLQWSFPPNVRLILSTLPGRSLEALKKRNWPELNVRPMEKEEQRKYVVKYLDQYRKGLSPARREKIIGEEPTANPLYLRTLLEELRVFGIHEELDKRIEHYLVAKTVEGLFNLVLERLEKDYERERKGLVGEVTTLLWASRKGISESEILELFEKEGKPVLRAHWSPLYLAVEESLVSRGGLLNFFHDFLKKAVESRYLPSPELKRKAHITIADYFDRREIDDRKADELPWQLCRAESWQRLKDGVTDMEMFLKLRTEAKQYELTGYWLSMGEKYDMAAAYNEMIEQYERTSPDASKLAYRIHDTASFLNLNARYEGAEPLYRRALAIVEKVLGPEHPVTAAGLNNLALLFRTRGDYEGAEPLLRRALAIREKVLGPKDPGMALSLNNLALQFRTRGDYEGAEPLFRRALAIWEKALGPEHPDTALSLHNLAELLYTRGDYEGAEPLLRRALAIREKVLGPEHPVTATSLNNLAALLYTKGDYEGAEPLYRRALAIREKVLGPEHPVTAGSLNNLALLLRIKGDYEGAEPLFRRALAIWEKVLGPEHPDTALSLCNLALLFRTRGDYEGAEPLLRRALAIREKVLGPEHPSTRAAKGDLDYLLKRKKRFRWKFWK